MTTNEINTTHKLVDTITTFSGDALIFKNNKTGREDLILLGNTLYKLKSNETLVLFLLRHRIV